MLYSQDIRTGSRVSITYDCGIVASRPILRQVSVEHLSRIFTNAVINIACSQRLGHPRPLKQLTAYDVRQVGWHLLLWA